MLDTPGLQVFPENCTRADVPRDHQDPLVTQLRPALGRNDLAIVSTGEPTAVLAAWGDGHNKWRVVLDRWDRLESVARVSGGVIGPVTMIPPAGTVHCLASALDYLEYLLSEPRAEEDALLPVFHWLRLVTTHNGDLLDFRQVRHRPEGRFPLYDRYARALDNMDREEPRLDPEGHLDTWAGQFSQRVRRRVQVSRRGLLFPSVTPVSRFSFQPLFIRLNGLE